MPREAPDGPGEVRARPGCWDAWGAGAPMDPGVAASAGIELAETERRGKAGGGRCRRRARGRCGLRERASYGAQAESTRSGVSAPRCGGWKGGGARGSGPRVLGGPEDGPPRSSGGAGSLSSRARSPARRGFAAKALPSEGERVLRLALTQPWPLASELWLQRFGSIPAHRAASFTHSCIASPGLWPVPCSPRVALSLEQKAI